MNPVLSEEQARKITGGRRPLVPVEYETALRSLAACISIDDAKYFADKADALAAWAKIYRDDKAGLEAKRLKLHAYRRMGELAEQLRPKRSIGRGPDGQYRGTLPGPQSLLKEHGFSGGTVNIIRRMAKLDPKVFNAAVSAKVPPSPTRFMNELRKCSEAWKALSATDRGFSLVGFRVFCRKYKSRELAARLAADERDKARQLAEECAEWLDEFLQRLPRK